MEAAEEAAESSESESAEKEAAEESTEAPAFDAAVAAKLVGNWKGEMDFDRLPEDERWIALEIQSSDEGELSGKFETPRGVTSLTGFAYDADKGQISFTGSNDNVSDVAFTCYCLWAIATVCAMLNVYAQLLWRL